MATSEAILGYGIIYAISTTAAGSTYTTIGEVSDIELPSDEVEEVDVTHYGSPARTREFIAGLINTGEASFTVNWIPGETTDIFLRGMRISGAVHNHKITFPNGSSVVYPGFIKGYSPSAPIDDKLSAQYTVKKAGAETWTEAA
jgi:predicted secreted protein